MILKTILTACILSIFSSYTHAQNGFEGKITTVATLQNMPNSKGGKTMPPMNITTYVSGNLVRVEQTSMVGTTVIIRDESTKKMTMLMDLAGKKIAIVMPIEEPTASESEGVKVEITNEKKTIAGHECRKAIVSQPEKGKTETVNTEIWFTDDLKNMSGQFNQVSGMPMEYTVTSENGSMNFLVTEVVKEKVDGELFKIPEGYEVKTKEDMDKMYPSFGEH